MKLNETGLSGARGEVKMPDELVPVEASGEGLVFPPGHFDTSRYAGHSVSGQQVIELSSPDRSVSGVLNIVKHVSR